MSSETTVTSGTSIQIVPILVGFGVIFVLAAVAGVLFREPLFDAGSWVVDQYGAFGLLGAVLVVDSFPTPMSYVPFMALGIAGGMSVVEVFLLSASASYVAGCLGYGIGRFIGLPRRLETWIHRRYPNVQDLLERYGGWGVAAVAVLPLPLAVGTWSAGSLRVNGRQAALALLLRIPKTAIYVGVLSQGLRLGSS